ncbi:hypothetical protein PFLUV_G00223960 [Perca fluviatilis]|uniref:Uncharacterized protein n=1 Tax=Perca fluviatilis TaxID=8168 RepID=A0A6A5EP57_PERFL|nr:hypothetical protein PFLUV_G00223960 [Perca fluviatilis]
MFSSFSNSHICSFTPVQSIVSSVILASLRHYTPANPPHACLILGTDDIEVLVRCPRVATRASLLRQRQLCLCPSTVPPLHIPYLGREEPLMSLCRSGWGIRPNSSQTSLFSGMMSSALCLLSSQRV